MPQVGPDAYRVDAGDARAEPACRQAGMAGDERLKKYGASSSYGILCAALILGNKIVTFKF